MWRLGLRSATMPTVQRVVAAPPDVVWEVLTDLALWPRWGPTVRRAELDPASTELRRGSTGRVWVLGGVALPFTITEFSAGHCWSWRVGGVGATKHYVRAHRDGSAVAFAVPAAAAPYLAVCALALLRIESIAAERS